jgi:hypothetical protein
MSFGVKSAAPNLRFTVAGVCRQDVPTRERLKIRSHLEPSGVGRRHISRDWRHQMRPFSYVIALVLLIDGPSLAGSADHDLPGIGTFTYNGSPIAPPAPAVMVAANLGH